MGSPITWRNVEGPNPAAALRPLESAGSSINNAFDIFSKVIQQRQALDTSNLAAMDEGNKQAYLDALQSKVNPEDVAAFEASGQAAAMRQSLTAAGRNAVRGAGEARLTSTRQAVTAGQQYGDQQAAIAERPMLDAFSRIVQSKNWEGAEQTIPNIMVRDKAKLQSQLTAAREADRLAIRGREKEGQSDEVARLQLDGLRTAADEGKRTRAEAERQRGLDAAANREIAGYHARTATRQAEAAPLFQAFDEKGFTDSEGNRLVVPRNKDGSVNYAAIGKNMRGLLEQELAANNSYTLDELSGSDTVARKELTDTLRRAGATPIDLARLEPVMASGLNTVPQALAGADLARAERAQRMEDVAMQEAAKQFVPLSDVSATATVANTVFEAIDKRYGGDTWKAEAWREAANKFLKEGIVAQDERGKPIKGANGEPIKVTPSAETMLQLLATVDTGAMPGFLGGSRWNSNDLERRLKQYKEDQGVYRAAGQAVSAGLLRNIRGIDPLPQAKPK